MTKYAYYVSQDLSDDGVQADLDKRGKDGYRVHTMLLSPNGGYTVLYEMEQQSAP